MSENNILYKWTFWGMLERKMTSLFLIIFYVFIGLLSAFFMDGSLFWGIFGFLLVSTFTIKFFLPIEYFFYEDKVVVKIFFMIQEKKWSSFRSYYFDNRGFLLSPFSAPSRLENFRGIYFIFGKKGNLKKIKEIVAKKIVMH